jgi:(R)-2-hydroxyglutarate---pyruvate transhydrogenase
VDPVGALFSCEAGVILEKADEHLRSHGFIMPLDLGAKGRYCIQ